VKVVDGQLNILCKHDSRDDPHGSVSREISRNYRLPDDIEPSSIRSHLTHQGLSSCDFIDLLIFGNFYFIIFLVIKFFNAL
jgi:hypothetical protein